ncbi:hypothetical protein Tco_0340934, partial [Tanacetum coccineum]
DDNELALVDPPKRKKKGPSKLKDKPTEPFKVEFDKNSRAIEQDQKDALWESIKKKRAIGKAYDKQQTNYAHIGRSGYRGMDVDLSKVELDEALEEEILNITYKKMAQGLIPKEKGADPLTVVLGPEHGGCTRAVRDDIDAARDTEIEVESENVEREASNEGRLQKRRKQSSYEGTKLPVSSKADDTITLLEQSVGSFFQWPRCRISRLMENTSTSKDKASQRKGATLEPTLATLNP